MSYVFTGFQRFQNFREIIRIVFLISQNQFDLGNSIWIFAILSVRSWFQEINLQERWEYSELFITRSTDEIIGDNN